MAIFLLVTIVIILLLYLLSKNKYEEFIQPLNKKEYSLKAFYPMALYLFEKINYKYDTKYDNKLLTIIAEIYGIKRASFYLRIHWANKIASLLLSLPILALMGVAIGEVDGVLIFLFIAIIGGIIYGSDKDLSNKYKKRHMMIQLEFPDFLSKLTLLIEAGMTVSSAWRRIVEVNDRDTPLYEELRMVVKEMNSGIPEYQSYENFAKRCRISQITKFVSVVLQNLRKGSTQLGVVLRLQSTECWNMRKDAAKKLGQEASTKLLFPMMLMFLGVLIIVAVPAILQMNML